MASPRYHPVSIALHWILVVLVFAQIALGWWMIEIPKSPPGVRASWFNLHKSIGLTIGMLMLARLGWRLRHGAPPLPDSMPRWQRTAAGVSHFLLYACLILQPLWGNWGLWAALHIWFLTRGLIYWWALGRRKAGLFSPA